MQRRYRLCSKEFGPRLAACASVLALLAACVPAEAPPPAGIVLVVIDTLRADGLSAYGNPRATSPHIDALAARPSSVLFEQAVSHAAWTLPGFVGLLAGEYPGEPVYRDRKLARSMVQTLQQSGFRTAAFTEGGYVSRGFGMDLGFERFEESSAKIRVANAAGRRTPPGGVQRTFDSAIAWLQHQGDAPFFLLVHTYEPHIPYRRTHFTKDLSSGRLGETYEVSDAQAVTEGRLEAGPIERGYVRALYDGGVAVADKHVGRLLAALDALPFADETIVVITSDHGEDLGERDPRALGRHQHHVHDELLRVPLIVDDPRTAWPAQRVSAQVRLIDVMPTLLDLAGVPPAADADGRSLAPLMRGEPEPERIAWAALHDPARVVFAVRTPEFKLIERHEAAAPGAPHTDLYDLRADPGEHAALAGEDARARAGEHVRLQALLREHTRPERGLAQPAAGGDCAADPGLCAQLEALGYLDAPDPDDRTKPGD